MRLFHVLAFDNLVQGTATIYTDPSLARGLGSADQLKIAAVADQVSGTSPTLTVQIEDSGEGMRWAAKNGTAEINASSLAASGTTALRGSDTGATGSTAFVRLRIQLGGTNPVARLRLWVTGRGAPA